MEKFYLLHLSFMALQPVVRVRNHVACWVTGNGDIKLLNQDSKDTKHLRLQNSSPDSSGV